MALRLTLAALAALSVALTIHGAGEGAIDETEIWNEGVELYRAGDYTNAHAKLKPLMLSRDYGARASELVAAIDYAFATSPLASQDGEKASSALEEAAQGAQIALRANPKDERLRRNFDRTIHDLPELRRTRKINAILQASASSSPDAILRAMRDSARSILEKSASYKTNSAHSAIAIADSLQAKCEKIADDWIAVKEGIARAVTNEEEIATISARLDDVRERTMAAAKSLGDFGDDAYGLVAATETDANKFYILTVLPPEAIREDQTAQSNAWMDVEAYNSRPWQPEALEYTRAFRAKFPAWAQAYEQQAAADTNMPPFTAEAQAQISSLSTELEKLQIECCKTELPPKQEEALEIIRKIIELMPEQKSNGGAPQQNPSGQNNDKSKSEPKDEPGAKDESDNGAKESEERQSEQNAQEGEEKEEASAQEQEGEKPEDKEVEAILKKAQERSDEHEAEKKARARKIPLGPNEKDW